MIIYTKVFNNTHFIYSLFIRLYLFDELIFSFRMSYK